MNVNKIYVINNTCVNVQTKPQPFTTRNSAQKWKVGCEKIKSTINSNPKNPVSKRTKASLKALKEISNAKNKIAISLKLSKDREYNLHDMYSFSGNTLLAYFTFDVRTPWLST